MKDATKAIIAKGHLEEAQAALKIVEGRLDELTSAVADLRDQVRRLERLATEGTSTRGRSETTERRIAWVVEALKAHGGRARFTDLLTALQKSDKSFNSNKLAGVLAEPSDPTVVRPFYKVSHGLYELR